MTWEFWLAVLKALPAFISLMSSIKATADAKTNQGIGYEQAVGEALAVAAHDHAAANTARLQAADAHAKNPTTDDGFDPDFKRPD